ncbi:arrestin domain-containing protein 2-like [Spodoptera litura]|uniref:Arrestin domain-containing protein 2-like n=1 Tax=Spodoptera litura TaxID=69820 RepID=A0A9J7IHE1_SPOLT|nr:arrestin domain-containing protein 2-like [Spodoptera litura]
MGVMCQILLDRTEDGVFKAGGLVTGTLKYFIDEPTQYEKISMCFLGKGQCYWSEKNNNSDNISDTTSYSNSEEYVNQTVNLYLGTNKQDLISGTFEYPFQFLLPNDIPPSFKDGTCTIRYKITVTFVKQNFLKTNNEFDVEIPVMSYVNPCSPEPLIFSLKKDLFSFKLSRTIELKGEIRKTCVAPGDNFEMTLTVNNNSNLSIFIKTELVYRVTYISSCNHKNFGGHIVKDTSTMSPIAANGVENLICVVPTLQNVYSIQHTKVMIREYRVRVTFKLPFPHINAVLEIPVTVGLRKHELLVPAVVYDQNEEESPPSYSSISTQNDNKGNEGEDFRKLEQRT